MERTEDIRWKQRFSNYSRMVNLLSDSFKDSSPDDFSELEQIGLGKAFEMSFELLWKLLKDYLEYEEIEIGLISPKNILKVSAESGLLEKMETDGDSLIRAHKARNDLVHIYDRKGFCAALKEIQEHYLPIMLGVERYFKVKCSE